MAATGARAQNLFVSNMSGGAIDKIAPSGVQTVFATGLNQPTGLAFDSTGDLFEADGGSGNIYEFINSGGTLSANPVVFASGFKDPQGLAFNSAGDLFVSQLNFNDGIIEITPGGTQSTFGGLGDNPGGLAFNSAGDLFASTPAGEVFEFTPGGAETTFASGTPQASPGLAFQPVPEPTIWGLLVAGAAALACRRRLQS